MNSYYNTYCVEGVLEVILDNLNNNFYEKPEDLRRGLQDMYNKVKKHNLELDKISKEILKKK